MKQVKKYVNIFLLALGVLLLYKILFDFNSIVNWKNQIMSTISPFIFGFVIAYCINMPVAWLELKLVKIKVKWISKGSRFISIIVNYALLVTFFFFGLKNLIPMIYDNVKNLALSLPDYIEQGLTALKGLPLVEDLGVTGAIEDFLDSNSGAFSDVEIDFWGSIGIAQGIFSVMFAVILTIVSSIYFLLEYNSIREFFKRLVKAVTSEEKHPVTLKYVRLIDRSFRKFLSCQFLDSLILGTITTIEFLILDSPYALVLGLMLGVVNIIPYFGSIVGSIVAVLITAFTNGFETAVLTAVILLITQQIDGNFINPKIMGTSFSVSPILVIIGITVGSAIGGIPGMIFAIPVVNVLKTVLEEYIQNREKIKAGIPIEYEEEDSGGGAGLPY